MPEYTRYCIEVETKVTIRTHDDKQVTTHIINKTSFANSDQKSLEAEVNNTAEAVLNPLAHFAKAIGISEKERLNNT